MNWRRLYSKLLQVLAVALLGIVAVSGCDSGDEIYNVTLVDGRPDRNPESVTISQGLWGDVWLWEGRFAPPETGTVRPVARDVVVFEVATEEDVTFAGPPYWRLVTEIRTPEVARTRSRPDGFYQISLPPGEYSLFVVEESMLWEVFQIWYGHVSRVVVAPGEAVEAHANILYHASF